MNPIKYLSTHSGRMERWYGKECCEQLSADMKNWYGPPIAVGTAPGAVWAHKGGDFRGPLRSGQFLSMLDFAEMRSKRILRNTARRSLLQNNAGFASLSDMISEATTGGKRRAFSFYKTGSLQTTGGIFSSLWRSGGQPSVGATPAAAAAGTAFDDSSAGAHPFTNPTGGDTQHFVTGYCAGSLTSNLLLYDLLFGVAKTMASTGTEAVTGVPTRYQSVSASDPDYVGGNFLFIQVGGTALANTGHNWTVCLYKDQDGNSSTLPSITGVAQAVVDRFDTNQAGQWFCPLEAGDVGIKALTQMQCSASVATGVIWFMIGHPIAWFPILAASSVAAIDGISTSFGLTRIFDDACLAMIYNQGNSTATNFTGQFITVAG